MWPHTSCSILNIVLILLYWTYNCWKLSNYILGEDEKTKLAKQKALIEAARARDDQKRNLKDDQKKNRKREMEENESVESEGKQWRRFK